MTPRTPEQRIGELARELAPVRPIAPLGAVAWLAAGVCLAAVALEWALGGLGLRVRTDAAWGEPSYLAAVAGVALFAGGATVAALASAVPGREAASRRGVALAGLGAALALLGTLAAVWAGGPAARELGGVLGCIERSAGLGLASALLVTAFVARAAPRHLLALGALAGAAGVGLGAWIVHLTCPSGSALHQLCGHVLAPLAGGLLLALPLGTLVRALSRERR